MWIWWPVAWIIRADMGGVGAGTGDGSLARANPGWAR